MIREYECTSHKLIRLLLVVSQQKNNKISYEPTNLSLFLGLQLTSLKDSYEKNIHATHILRIYKKEKRWINMISNKIQRKTRTKSILDNNLVTKKKQEQGVQHKHNSHQ